MISDSFNSADYANYMSEVLENLIVKAGKQLPKESKISGETIKKWKVFTIQYFKVSPDVYLIQNEFYQTL